jgi:hypothetical protein
VSNSLSLGTIYTEFTNRDRWCYGVVLPSSHRGWTWRATEPAQASRLVARLMVNLRKLIELEMGVI